MIDKHFKGGHDGLINDAIATLDMALWDLKAKANDEPLWKTLGGSKQRVHCYASEIGLPMSDEDLQAWYGRMAKEHGFRGGKLKVGLDQDADMRRLGLMEKALSQATDAPMLLIDANEYWSPKQAIRKVSEMEEQFDLTWVEEPARRWDYLGLRRVKEGVRTAVCAGENLDTLGDFLPYFHHRFFHLLEGQDPREVAGLWRKMVDYAHKGGVVAGGGPIGAIDVALWDLKAKIAGEPLWQTFGALEGRTKAYASGIGYCLSDEEVFTFYRRMAERGVDGGKLKIGLDMAADLRRIGIMREALSVAAARPRSGAAAPVLPRDPRS